MKSVIFAVVFSCVVLFTVAQSDLLLFSDRNYVPEGWVKGDRAIGTELMTVRIFLKQRNLDELERVFLDVSNPTSRNYGKHWSIERITNLVAPEEQATNTVINYLVSSGVLPNDIINFKDSIKFSAPARVIERTFNTEIYEYTRVDKPNKKALAQYGTSYLPTSVQNLIQIVTGVDTFPAFRKTPIRARPATPLDVGYVIPDTIRRVYNVPSTTTTNDKSSVGLIEFEDDNSFNPQDLVYFEQQMAVATTKVTHIVGPFNPSNPDAESTLDVQYATAIADNTTVWFWTVTGWMLDFSQDFYNTQTVPLVISMSWGWTPQDQCQIVNCNGLTNAEYVSRTNTEWQKIGTRGISVFAASGDQGAPGDGNAYCDSTTAPLNGIFPGDSPYVTSVGATMLVASSSKSNLTQNQPPICKVYQCATSNTEAVCTYPTALITTGGGFGYYSAMPSWQETQVNDYLKSGVQLPPSQYFNAKNRGFPDIAALGHNYLIRLGGSWVIVDGTSCSSPVWAAIIALINDARLNAGKSPLGFVAPLLYSIYQKDPTTFHSLPTGNNKCTESCCAQYGYLAGPAWDPLTGLGSPDFTKLFNYAMTA